MEALDRIIEFAQKWDGIEELPGNSGFKDDHFQSLMEEIGWQKGWPWCASYVKMVYYNVFKQIDNGVARWIQDDFTHSATETYEKCEENPRWTTVIKQPVPGSVVIWRKWENGEPSWKGHAGIIVIPGAGEFDSHFKSIEGNTNDEGGRLGIEVAVKTRRNNHFEKNGLVVEGFILPPVPLEKIDPKQIKI